MEGMKMINKTLFAREWKANYKLLLIFLAVLTMYISIIISMFDPKLGRVLEEFTEAMPEMMSLFGMAGMTMTLVGFLSNYLYGMLLIAFPMVFLILLSLRLVVKYVDQGAMSYLLSSQTSRACLIRTQVTVLVTNIFVLDGYCVLLGIACSEWMFPGKLDMPAYLSLNMGMFCLHFFLAGYCFMISCMCNESRKAALAGAGIPVLFLLLQMLSNMEGAAEWLRYLTLFSMFQQEKLIEAEATGYIFAVGLFAIGAVCLWIGKRSFERRDLPL